MKKLSPSTIKLLGIVLFVVSLNCILFVPGWVGTIKYPAYFLSFQQKDDSWFVMNQALKCLEKESCARGQLYSQLFFTEKVKFQYPPTSLFVPYALSQVFSNYFKALGLISWAGIVTTILFVILIFRRAQSMCGQDAPRSQENIRNDNIVTAVCLCVLSLLFYPIVKSYNLGQIQTWLNALFAMLFYCWLRNWQVPSGILLGVMCLIKPQYVLIALWGILRKKWTFVSCVLGIALLGLLLSCALFGIENHFDYLPVLSFLSHHGEAYYPNQSINGLLNRFHFN
jgi:alpha-1,2-mannosyltransferase